MFAGHFSELLKWTSYIWIDFAALSRDQIMDNEIGEQSILLQSDLVLIMQILNGSGAIDWLIVYQLWSW